MYLIFLKVFLNHVKNKSDHCGKRYICTLIFLKEIYLGKHVSRNFPVFKRKTSFKKKERKDLCNPVTVLIRLGDEKCFCLK